MIDDMINGGIFGMIRSGKTTLCRKIAWYFWKKKQIRAIVLDPKGEWWPECCTVFRVNPNDKAAALSVCDEFWKTVWANSNCVIVVDEAALTIQRDRELMPAFTMMNARSHKFIVIGHSGADLLPGMRQQITHLFLFRQSEQAAQLWEQEFAEKKILQAQSLGQYEYLVAPRFKPVQKFQLTK